MSKAKPREEWQVRANSVLWGMGMPKTEFAAMIGVNYTHVCNVISGNKKDAKTKEKILAKLDELERGVVLGDVSDGV